ncbi:MAG: site-2 protease family protein [Elusimicrobiota bacterium]
MNSAWMRGPRSCLCIVLSAALVITSPGLFCYEALGAMVAGTSAAAGVSAVPAGAAGAVLGAVPLQRNMTAATLNALQTTSVLPGLETVAPAMTQRIHGLIQSSAQTIKIEKEQAPAPLHKAQKSVAAVFSTLGFISSDTDNKTPARRTPAPQRSPWTPVRAAEEFRILFDGGRRRKNAVSSDVPQGIHSRKANGVHISLTGPGLSEVQMQEVPAPAAAPKTSIWDSAIVRVGLPTAALAATALLYSADLVTTGIMAGTLMVSILAHETAHILGLRIWGDKTPAKMGRDSLNPLAHADAVGTILVPAASAAISNSLIGVPIVTGWAKPVPVEFNNLKNVKKDAAKVAIMGPLANLALAALTGTALLALPAGGTAALVLSTMFKANLALVLFNLIPTPWSDGGKVLISLLPERIYSWWRHNPRIPDGYQNIYQRLYEGPSHVLSSFNLDSRGQINGATRALTLAGMGAFVYLLSGTMLHLPIMLLALPCNYDYWCIAEKVRSEKAVGEMMDLLSSWGTLLVQLAEDHDVESEVSAKDAELNLAHAIDVLLETLMAKEEFRNLPDDEKIERFMAEFPEFAARDLRNKAFTEDTVETILKVLNDARNQPFKDRLKSWLKEHGIFKKMASPHEKKHYKDQMEEAKKDKTRGAGS